MDLHLQVIQQGERFDAKGNFCYTTIVILRESGFSVGNYYHRKKCPRFIDFETIRFDPIPFSTFPKYYPGIFTTTFDLNSTYIKRPCMLNYMAYPPERINQLMMNENRVYEALKKSPHPHLVTYYGAIRQNDRVTAFCLKKYSHTLEECIRNQYFNLDANSCYEKLVSAVYHLHSLGFCHNDINPSKIMFDERGEQALINYNSCQLIGQTLLDPGSKWYPNHKGISCVWNDTHALGAMLNFFNANVGRRSGLVRT